MPPSTIPRLVPLPPDLPEEELRRIEEAVFFPSDPRKSDLLFVFGYPKEDWKPLTRLYHQSLAPIVLATGWHGKIFDPAEPPQAHQIRDALIREGVPPSAILVEDRSRSTLENVRLGKELLDARNIHPQSILFAAHSHHGGRCLRTLTKFFPGVTFSCFAYDGSYDGVEISRETWRENPVAQGIVYGEYLRIKRYAEEGSIAL